MRSVPLLAAAALTLAGCAVVPIAPQPAPVAPPVIVRPPVVVAPAPTSTVSSVTRAAAVSVVNREMAKRLPGVNVVPYTSCVVSEATQAELADLAGMGSNTAVASSAVAAIVKRPGAAQCIATVARTA